MNVKRNLLCGAVALCCLGAMAQKPTDILSVSASSGQEKAALAFDKNVRTMWEVSDAALLGSDQWLMCTLQTPGDVCGLSLQAQSAGLDKQEFAQWLQVFVTYDPMNLGEPVASIATNGQWFQSIAFVPTGDYIMGTSRDSHYVFKAMYDWEKKAPTNPMPFAGSGAGYGEGVGTTGAFFNSPRQGVFVYNEEYAAEGRAPQDCYDYYVAGSANHCIHKVTPDAVVSTYAGRGSVSVDGEVAGYIDGDLREDARFNWPEGICYSEARQTFYISGAGSHRIRTIAIQ